MAADTQDTSAASTERPPAESKINLPDELISNVLFQASTPTLIQLTRSSKQFFHNVRNNRQLLLHHLDQIPGDKSHLGDKSNENLWLLLRQRAANNLYGANFSANLHEYLVPNVQLEPSACSVAGLDADYVRMALVFKDATDIRQYTSHCAIREKITEACPPGAKIWKTVQWGRFVSILCSWPEESTEEFPDGCHSGSESNFETHDQSPFPPSAGAQLQLLQKQQEDVKITSGKSEGDRLKKHHYRIVHFDIYTLEDSHTFTIEGHLDYVPKDFAVHSLLHCAILWDRDVIGGRPTADATILDYCAAESALLYPTRYESNAIWPKANKPPKPENDSDDEDIPEHFSERIEFFKDGRRIKIYDAGGVVPYQILSTATTQHESYASTNLIDYIGEYQFRIDTPFYGTHATIRDETSGQSICHLTHLCLGVATVDMGHGDDKEEVRVLCILRSSNKYYAEGCNHKVSLDRMAHISANSSRVVARLWGWEEQDNNLTGVETVAVSPGGTRIAIAMWNKVLVYPLNPKILCENVPSDDSDDEVKLQKKKKKSKKVEKSPAATYYYRKKDSNLLGWKIVELRPVVLDLQGPVAHKMNWSAAKGRITDTNPAPVLMLEDGGEQNYLNDASLPTDDEHVDNSNEEDNMTSAAPTTHQEEGDAVGDASQVQEAVVQEVAVQVDPTATTSNDNAVDIEQTQQEDPLPAEKDVPAPSLVAPLPQIEEDNEVKSSAQAKPTGLNGDEQVSSHPTPPSETIQAMLETSLPVPPPSYTSTLGSTPTSPFSPSLNPSQPFKPSSRKKDKSAEATIEAMPPMYQKEKPQAQYGSFTLESKPMLEPSAPAPPVISKNMPKPKQTISEALSDSTALPPSANVNLPNLPPSSSEAANEAKPANPIITQDVPTNADTTISDNKAAGEVKTEELGSAAETDPSTTSTDIAADTASDTGEVEKEDKPKPRKRITEDELIILTDRGIQIWNIGARAKGKRKKSILQLEESLKGRVPLRHQKMKSKMVEDALDEEIR